MPGFSLTSGFGLGVSFKAQHAQSGLEMGEVVGHTHTASNLWLLLRCNRDGLYKLCSATREIQNTYTTSNNSSPSPCSSEREPVVREFGCRDGCVLWRQCHIPISHYRFSCDSRCYALHKVSPAFWSERDSALCGNNWGFHNVIFFFFLTQMT